MIKRAWLNAATIAPMFVWSDSPIHMKQNTVPNHRFNHLIEMVSRFKPPIIRLSTVILSAVLCERNLQVVQFLHNCIIALDLQMPAIEDYIRECGARHAKHLGTG